MISYNQVKKTFLNRYVFNKLLRFAHSNPPAKVLYPLESRSLLKIKGNDAPVFLQGLVTNDMRHFEEGAKSMYAMFLNNKGRVLYDTLIHQGEEIESYMIECDKQMLTMLLRHLKLYKLKRMVEIEDVTEQYRIWALISSENSVDTEMDPSNSINIYKDPRLSELGCRVLSAQNMEGSQVAKHIGNDIIVESAGDGYKCLRYKLGVSEGAEDLPPGSCFPLEVNCDYLHGVSFHKGCYIGQELTARVHHTGVVRKRIMPFKFKAIPKENIEKDTTISASDNPKSNLGKFKGFANEYGIGLIRVKEALDAKLVNIGTHTVEVLKPAWWPVEAPKEKLMTKNE
jgi:transferase CAF17, mitochondrial